MKAVWLACAVLLAWQSCDVRSASQEQVRQKLEEGLRPYFPRVQVVLDRDQQQLTAFTCASNLGQAAVEMVPGVLDHNDNFQKLKQFHNALRLRAFALVFDHYVVTEDFERGSNRTVPIEQAEGMTVRYAQACGQTAI
jgi:hypothetical protein